MKKHNPPNEKAPFLKDKNHIYRLLEDGGHKKINLGWDVLNFELIADLKCSEGIGCDGITEFSEKAIKFEMFLDDLTARETIIHELFHCMLEGGGMDERNFHSESIKISNEALVVILSKQQVTLNNLNPGLYSLLLDTPCSKQD